MAREETDSPETLVECMLKSSRRHAKVKSEESLKIFKH